MSASQENYNLTREIKLIEESKVTNSGKMLKEVIFKFRDLFNQWKSIIPFRWSYMHIPSFKL